MTGPIVNTAPFRYDDLLSLLDFISFDYEGRTVQIGWNEETQRALGADCRLLIANFDWASLGGVPLRLQYSFAFDRESELVSRSPQCNVQVDGQYCGEGYRTTEQIAHEGLRGEVEWVIEAIAAFIEEEKERRAGERDSPEARLRDNLDRI